MTVAQFRSAAWDLLGLNSSDARATKARLNDYLHEGMVRMAYDAYPPHLLKRQTTNISSGQSTYYINSDMMVPVDVRVAGKMVPFKNRFDLFMEGAFETYSSSASTKCWTYDGVYATNSGNTYGKMSIRLVPAYNANSNSGLVITYLRRPHKVSDMVNTSREIIDIPAHYHNALVHFAAARFMESQAEVADAEKIKFYMEIFTADKVSYVKEMQMYDPLRQKRLMVGEDA